MSATETALVPMPAGEMPSASGLTRAINCPPSCILPAADFTTSYGEHGRTLHDFIRVALTSGRTEALATIAIDDLARGACEALDVNILPKGGHLEVAFAWSWRTAKARILGYNIGRRYREHGLRDDEIPGSADFAGAQPGIAVIVDWKTGYLLEAAKNSWQLAFLGMCAADVFGADRARVGHLIIRDEQPPRWDIAELDELSIMVTRTAMVKLVDTLGEVRQRYVAGQPLRFNQGLWCKYCPAFDRCPAKMELAREMLAGLDQVGPLIEAMTVGELGQLLLKIERWDAIKGRVYERIDERARRGEKIPLGDGRVLQLAPGRDADQIVNPHQALTVLAQMCGIEYAEKATETGKGKINEAVRQWAKANGRKIGESQEFVIDEIRKAGAIKKLPGKVEPRIVKDARAD